MTKVFTMVKDEADIVEAWIIYHAKAFGWQNIYVVDNFSTDGTWAKLLNFQGLIHIYRKEEYTQKGVYMHELIHQNCKSGEIAIPLDIDEFIVFFDKSENKIDANPLTIYHYLKSLPPATLYTMHYIQTLITNESGYENAVVEASMGRYEDPGYCAKIFFNVDYFNGYIDNGNHIGMNTDYYLSSLCLVHYHFRSLDQIKQKIRNNVSGFHYDVDDAESLKLLLSYSPNCQGYHHVQRQIRVLENTFSLPIESGEALKEQGQEWIDLTPLRTMVTAYLKLMP